MTTDYLTTELEQGLQALTLSYDKAQSVKLAEFMRLLQKWNASYNLVADCSSEVLLRRHLLDSLTVSPYLAGERLLDVGSGAGFPGIPLAIMHPRIHVILLDSNGKKTRFLFQVKLALSLENVSIENCRIEHYQSSGQIDIVTCRAFSSLSETVDKTSRFLTSGSRLLAMKGRCSDEEIAALDSGFTITRIDKLTIPGDAAERHLIELVKFGK